MAKEWKDMRHCADVETGRLSKTWVYSL